MSEFAEFTEQELDIIRQTLQQQFGIPIEIHLANTQLQLDQSSPEVSECPAVYFQEEGCHYIINKTGEYKFQCEFFFDVHDHFGTGREFYDDLAECTLALLQAQADYLRNHQG